MQATSNISRAITTLGHGVVDLLWPPSCLGCGTHVETAAGLCPPCWARARFITGLACTRCGLPLPGTEDMAVQCDDCHRHPPPWTRGVATALYAGPMRQLVLGLKHGDRLDLARPLGNWLARTARPLITPDTLVAPVPLHWWRRLQRRSDQAALLATRVALAGGGHPDPRSAGAQPRHTQPGPSGPGRAVRQSGGGAAAACGQAGGRPSHPAGR